MERVQGGGVGWVLGWVGLGVDVVDVVEGGGRCEREGGATKQRERTYTCFF